MKYRRLEADELQELETEFIQFLSANTITGPDWEKLKQSDPSRAEALIDLFSDIVFDKVIRQIRFLEVITPRDIRTFQCDDDLIRMNGLRVVGNCDLDFTRDQKPTEWYDQARAGGATLQAYSGEKGYQPDREEELFRMMQQGALISRDGHLYQTLEALKGPDRSEAAQG